jgi:hypothetical protein
MDDSARDALEFPDRNREVDPGRPWLDDAARGRELSQALGAERGARLASRAAGRAPRRRHQRGELSEWAHRANLAAGL